MIVSGDDAMIVPNRRSAETTVRAKDGEPIVISGLLSQQVLVTNDGSVAPVRRETELLIIMRAEIIKDAE